MTRQQKRTVGLLLGALALVMVVVLAARDGGDDTSGLDKRSYEAGYDAFGGAYLPSSEEDREMVEVRCEEMWTGFAKADDEAATYKKASWVTGCADYVEGKDSRF